MAKYDELPFVHKTSGSTRNSSMINETRTANEWMVVVSYGTNNAYRSAFERILSVFLSSFAHFLYGFLVDFAQFLYHLVVGMLRRFYCVHLHLFSVPFIHSVIQSNSPQKCVIVKCFFFFFFTCMCVCVWILED